MKDMNTRVPCSVTKELVYEIANRDKKRFIDGEGHIILPKVLHTLGFKIDEESYYLGFYKTEDVYVRDNSRPYLHYKTTIYNGEVRNQVIGKDGKGNNKYNRTKHSLGRIYEHVGVLQPTNLSKYVDKARFVDMADVGDQNSYDKGYLASDKKATGGSTRNIVRK